MIRRKSAAGRKLISRTTTVSPLAISRPVYMARGEDSAVDQSQLPFSITYHSLDVQIGFQPITRSQAHGKQAPPLR